LAGITPLTQLVGYTLQPLPRTVPGFRTELQPTSTLSPSIAPNFLRPVSIFSVSDLTTTSVLSLLTLEVIDPAHI